MSIAKRTRQSRLESLDTTAGLLRARANRHAWIGLLIAVAAIVAATLLVCLYRHGAITLDAMADVHAENPALWFLDAMPLLFLVWGQYIGTMMSYQAGAMVLDETRDLREEASRLQYQLGQAPVPGQLQGWPNRHGFTERIDRAALRRGGKGFAVLSLSTEQYHEIALSQGEEAAITYIRQLGERIKSVSSDDEVLAHFGHDDFGLLLPNATDLAEARRFAGRVQLALDLPLQLGRQALSIRAGIGIALYPQHGGEAESLLRHAESAKFAALADRQDCYVYEPQLDQQRGERPRLSAELHGALYNEGLADDYQLQQPLQAELPPRLRLLPYWEHPRRGRLEEAEFLHLPERLGLIHGLSLWLLREGLGRLAHWRQSGAPELGLVLRLPDGALSQIGLNDMVLRLLHSHDLPPAALTLEWQESALIAATDAQRTQLGALKDAGVHQSLLGVGAPGASALASLYLPLNEAQFADSLLKLALQDPTAAEAMEALVRVLKRQHQRVVLTGVRGDAARRFIAALGADYSEGDPTHTRMTPEGVERWLQQRT